MYFQVMEKEYLKSQPSALINLSPKYCICCEKQVRGRTDKKFCCDACRNNYNNRLKAETTNLVRNINHALTKNRRILEGFLRDDKATKVSASNLLHNGFQFKYFTHQYINKKGNTYCFCYDFGYLPVDNNCYLLIKKI
jgi:predicted nucleic acid-binding Zn ribbon protein